MRVTSSEKAILDEDTRKDPKFLLPLPSQVYRDRVENENEYKPVHHSSGAMKLDKNNGITQLRNKLSHTLWSDDNPSEDMLEKEKQLKLLKEQELEVENNKLNIVPTESLATPLSESDKAQYDRMLLIQTIELLFREKFILDPKTGLVPSDEACHFDDNAVDHEEMQALIEKFKIPPKTYKSLNELKRAIGLSVQDEPEEFIDDNQPEEYNIYGASNSPKYLGGGKMKEKLLNLGKFVNQNVNRKIMSNWEYIEKAFLKSKVMKTVLDENENGLMYPAKYHALKLNVLIGLLCSEKVKIKYNELSNVFQKFNDPKINDQSMYHGRKVAALRALMNGITDLRNGSNSSHKKHRKFDFVKKELSELLKEQHQSSSAVLISLKEFKSNVFVEKASRLITTIGHSHLSNNDGIILDVNLPNATTSEPIESLNSAESGVEDYQMINKEKAQERIEQFNNELRTVQKSHGLITLNRLDLLKSIIDYCEKSVSFLIVEKDITVSEEIISLLGIEVFPDYIKDALASKKKKAADDILRITTTSASTIHSINNILSLKSLKNSPQLQNQVYQQSLRTSIIAVRSQSIRGNDKGFDTPGIISPSSNSKLKQRRKSDAVFGFNGNFRVKFTGIIYLLQETVASNKGLQGYDYSDVIELVQAYASTRLQGFFRG